MRSGVAPQAVPRFCGRRGHGDSVVRPRGSRVRADGTLMLRFHCTPTNGDGPHWFEVDATADATTYALPQRCPDHPGSKVWRDGTYSRNGHPRQRYRCFPADGSRSHVFASVVPRHLVEHGEHCPACSEERSVHGGEAVVGRGHHYSARQVADGLIALSRGASYASVAVEARLARAAEGQARRDDLNRLRREKAERARKRAADDNDVENGRVPGRAGRSKTAVAPSPSYTPLPPLGVQPKGKDAWRLAASWVETFTPVLWEPWDAACRREAEERRLERDTLRVVAVDDKPYAGGPLTLKGYRPQLFAVLVLTEIQLDASGQFRSNRLRLIRAYPHHRAEAYLLLFRELGYVPDIVLSDGGTSITSALKSLAPAGEPPPDRLMSSHHIVNQVNRNLATMAANKATPFAAPLHLVERLNSLEPVTGRAQWDAWWSDLEAAWNAQGIPERARMTQWRRDYLPAVLASLDLQAQYPGLPLSTGSIESQMRRALDPVMSDRADRFGSLARLNQLLNLVTLAANRQLLDPALVADKLRRDARAHGGYAPPTRTLHDPGTYRSLHDDELPALLLSQEP